ncbi:MAG: M50 family metallopeptidase [Nanoarchaeota archaeon]|nr:M50 family metallopeptidase [Nanoarchaeota archaeon]
MIFITIGEIISLIIITVVLGYIFVDYVAPRTLDPFTLTRNRWKDIQFAAMIIAPAVIVHELFHKFVAMSFGFSALFKIYWFGLGLGLILKLVKSPILILAPAFVVYPAIATASQNMLIAFAGPLANLLMFLGATIWIKYGKLNRKKLIILALTKKINLFLFIFNMIPIPPFDGYYVLNGLLSLF